MKRVVAGLLFVLACAPPAVARQAAGPPTPLRELVADGVSVFTLTEIRWALHLEDNTPLPATPEALADRLQSRYIREGYTKATVRASFDAATGRLVFRADEGRIDAVVFEGVDQKLGTELRGGLAVHPGDVFNTRQVSSALRKVLAPTGGAIRPASDGRDNAFDLVERDGKRTLVLSVRRRGSDFDAAIGTQSREDWYSPVDGLNLALGFDGAIYDQRRFAHTYLQGYISYKFARESVGYNLALERPLVTPRFFVNADVHDTTASDDFWRLSIAEQSLVSLTFKNSFRDYYTERGYQLGAAFQPNHANEFRVSWRANRHAPLDNETDYSLFRDAEFRPNRRAGEGKLRSLVLGYTLDTRGLDDEEGGRRLARHTGPDLFGTFGGARPGYRLDWTSEIARSGFGGDFAFTRHIANARAYVPISDNQQLRARLIAGASSGSLPPQRWFALGGIGSVHGYSIKEAAGDSMFLANVEYFLGSTRDLHVLGFLDLGRVSHPFVGRDDWQKGIGVGIGLGDLRVDFGWRADDIPKSLQVLVRFGPTF